MSYQIADEPHPSDGRNSLVFRPSAPLFAVMWCGAWLAFPWFALNAFAMRSPTARREMKLAAIALAGTAALALGVYGLVDLGVIESRLTLQIALLAVTAYKLGFAYTLSTIQSRTFNVYTYYGGTVQKAMYVLIAGHYLRPLILGLVDSPAWRVIVSGGL